MRDRYRYRRRTATRNGSTGHSLFGSTGWLFADLLLALALTFLLATTVGAAPHLPKKPPAPHSSATSKPPPKPPTPQAALNLNYVTVHLSDLSASSIQQTIMASPQLRGQRSGLVILFAGGPSSGGNWGQVDSQVWSILQGMNKETPLFKVAVSRQFWDGTLPLNQVTLNVYLFKTSP
jgi:hypothetical protein